MKTNGSAMHRHAGMLWDVLEGKGREEEGYN